MSSIEPLTARDPAELLLCPLCQYDLRGLTLPRCPECGYAFEWQELRDPARRLHPFLFEHHPERNAWSFYKTLTRGLFVRRFWWRLYPTQLSNPRRMLIYWLITVAIVASWFVPWLAMTTMELHSDHKSAQQRELLIPLSPLVQQQVLRGYGSLQAWVETLYPTLPNPRVVFDALRGWRMLPWAALAFFAVAWPWLTFAGLMVFQISMRRAKIRPVHVLRCIIYSADVTVLISLVAFAAMGFEFSLAGSPTRIPPLWYSDFYNLIGPFLIMLLFLVLTYRLWMAYRIYLRFRHAFMTVLLSQVMLSLLLLKLSLDLNWIK
jgi:hypothetical protein